VANGEGRLRVDPFLPEDAVIRLVGGPDYQFYVESDGDDSDLDGENQVYGEDIRPWFDTGLWRIELQPGAARTSDRFLVVLTPYLGDDQPSPPEPLALSDPEVSGIAFEQSVILLLESRRSLPLTLPVPSAQHRLIVIGLAPLAEITLTGLGVETQLRADDEGVLYWNKGSDLPSSLTLAAASPVPR